MSLTSPSHLCQKDLVSDSLPPHLVHDPSVVPGLVTFTVAVGVAVPTKVYDTIRYPPPDTLPQPLTTLLTPTRQ